MSTAPLALYIHVPFCRRRCTYCHFEIKVFHRQTDTRPFISNYVACVSKELATYGSLYPNRPLTSIYYGGGTPSQLGIPEIETIQKAVAEAFLIDKDCEINMEVNPEDATPYFLDGIRMLGINRISFGVQSFTGKVLEGANRMHDAETAYKAMAMAPHFPKGISFDLILGLPFQTGVARELEMVKELAPDHISLYMLERDVPTPLDKRAVGMRLPSEDDQAAFYEETRDFLKSIGFRHYEISNFARPGFLCRHNLVYWQCGDYLGVGPAAHGHVDRLYTANHPRLSDYLDQVHRTGRGVLKSEEWSPERYRREQIIQGLRLDVGVPRTMLTERELEDLGSVVRFGLVRYQEDRVLLTDKGRLLANEVFQLFV